jgi:UDP-N-acetylglucosamine:LPS N-acetylglucosamine transferase
MKKQKVMFVAGIGGHITQLLQLDSIFDNYDYVFITEKSTVNSSLEEKYNMRYLHHISRNQKLLYPLIIIWNCFLSLFYFIKYNPKVIVTTGPNTAAAMCCLGKIFGKKVIFIESFAKRETPSITGKWIYKFHAYTTFVVQWKSMLKHYPKAEYWGGIY